MTLLKLAFRNIARNVRRSIITVIAVGVGVTAILFLWAFSDGTADGMRDNVTRLFSGHVQIHASGFDKTLSAELTVPEREKVETALNGRKDVRGFSTRVKSEALVGTSEKSRGVLLIGIDPAQEPKITDLHENIRKGNFLSEGQDRKILISDLLAEKIGVNLGDKVVILTNSMEGMLSGFSYEVTGIFHTGSQQVDESTVYITLASAQELLGIEKDVHEFIIQLTGRDAIPGFLEFAKSGFTSERYEVLPWYEVVPEPELWLKWYDGIMNIVLITVMVVISVGVMNTILMSVFERTKELGVMLAIGTSPSQVVGLILLETLILEWVGIAFGVFSGYSLVGYFNHVGISFAHLETALSQSYVSTVTYPIIKIPRVIHSSVSLMIITLVVSVYPAWKAGRLEPIKAIYHSY